MVGDRLDHPLDREIGRRLAEGAHRLLHGLVGGDRDGAVLHAVDAIGPDDRADRLAELERRAARIGADIVERPHLHRADDAGIVEGGLDVEVALRPVGVAAAHVLEPILDQPHRDAEPAREVADQHGVLDAALDAIAAADVDVVVDAHRRAGKLQRRRDLVRIARHLHRGPDVEDLAPGIPTRQHAEGLDRHRGAAPPLHLERQVVRAVGEILLDRAPDERAVEQHIGAVIGVHRRAAGRERLLAVEHERQLLVLDRDRLGGVLGERAGVRDHRRHPFARIARYVDGERAARHVRRIEPRHQRHGRGGKLAAVEHVMHAGQAERRGLVDGDDARRRVWAGDERHVAGARQGDVGGEPALTDHEAAVLPHPAVGRYEAERRGRRTHGCTAGWLRPRMRSAASAIASTIWA